MPDLRDFRCRITAETDAVLEAEAIATGFDKAEFAREWLDERAKERIHVATLTLRLLPAKGNGGHERE